VALELIYTSAPRGLRAGTSGYCTVAQSRGMREDLASALERRSLFAHEPKDSSPTYFSFRHLSLGGTSWRILSRAQDAGLDFTGRRHYLVHHLALDVSEETGGLQPGEILLGWSGWRESWAGAPEELAVLPPGRWWQDIPRIFLPAREWNRQTGDAGWAAYPEKLASPVGWLSTGLSSEELLRMMAESAALAEESQKGRSWFIPLDAGGPANPIPKDCQWVARSPWRHGGMPAGIRACLRIEDFRGKQAEGRAEAVELARTGRGKPAVRSQEKPVARAGIEDLGEPARPTGPGQEKGERIWRRWAGAVFVLLSMGVAGGFWFLHRIPPAPAATSVEDVADPAPPLPGSMPQPSHRLPQAGASLTPAQMLQQALWREAGGQEPIEVLHLLFGKPAPAGVIEDEVGLLLQGTADGRVVRGPGDWSAPVSLEGKENRASFCREAAKKTSAWSVFVPATSRGLAYVPDPFAQGAARNIPTQLSSPGEILDELGRRIFLDPQRWSLVIHFPGWEEQKFMPVRIGPQDSDRLWIDRVDQHRSQMRVLRGEALRRLAPWLGEDPERWDERKIRTLTAQMKGGNFPEFFEQFHKLDEEYRSWWLPPVPGEGPGEIFGRLLKNSGVRCEVQLDGLVVGRLVPKLPQ